MAVAQFAPRRLSKLQYLIQQSCNYSSFPDTIFWVPASSPSRGGDVAVYAFDMNQPSLPTPFYSVLVSISVFTAFSTVFHSIQIFPTTPGFLTLLFQFYFCLIGPFNYISLYESIFQP